MKKGISLIVLAITIIVMIILLGVIVITSSPTVASTEKYRLQMDISQLETLMNTYRIRKNGKITFETVLFDTSYLSLQELQQFEGETIEDNNIKLYVVDLKEIDAEQVNYGNLKQGATDRYLYSLKTGRVYYEQGLKVEDITYYYVEDGDV